MKLRTFLLAGLLLLLTGFTFKAESETWATIILVPPQMHTGTATIYTADVKLENAYYSTGEELSILGIVLISISALKSARLINRRY